MHTKATDGHFLAPANRLLKRFAVYGVLNCSNLPIAGRDLSIIYDKNYKPNQTVVKQLFGRVNTIVLSIQLDNIP